MINILKNNFYNCNSTEYKNSLKRKNCRLKTNAACFDSTTFASKSKKAIKIIETKSGKFIDAVIQKEKSRRISFKITKDGKYLGHIHAVEKDSFIKIDDLVSLGNQNFKGIGKYLIQSMVEESFRRGFKGRLKALAQKPWF